MGESEYVESSLHTDLRSSDESHEKGLHEDIVSTSTESKKEHRRDIGTTSAVFLILNKMIGTGIFSTPSSIVKLAGSPGLALIFWAIGALISMSGLMVYLEFGTMLPGNGGEKHYLNYVYCRPALLAISMYCLYLFLLGNGANSSAFGSYICEAAGIKVDDRGMNAKLIGFGCLSFAYLAHSVGGKHALRLQNTLGIFKVVILLLIIVGGWVGWAGGANVKPTHSFRHSFAGKSSSYGAVTSLYNVVFSYAGYNNANYALAETRNPQRVLKFAAPAALIGVSILYILANISYLGVVSPDEFGSLGVIVASEFFARLWGESARKAVSVFVSLSAAGNVMAVLFTQSRLIQEFAKEGILPFSSLISSSLPFDSPFGALTQQYIVTTIILLAPPQGDSYDFLVNLSTYPGSVMNMFLALALIIIYVRGKKHYPDWNPSIKATLPVAVFFFLANLYLIIAPFIPPDTPSENTYKTLPYYLHCVVGIGLLVAGGIWWLFAFKIWPYLRGYVVKTETHTDINGWSRNKIVHVPKNPEAALHKKEPNHVVKAVRGTIHRKAEATSIFWRRWVHDSEVIPSGVLSGLTPNFDKLRGRGEYSKHGSVEIIE